MIEDLLRSIVNAPPTSRRVEEDIEQMKEETVEWQSGLFPWVGANELELLSMNHDSKSFKQSYGKALKGVFYSIYNEPMIVFGYKSYLRSKVNTVIWATTKQHTFEYRGSKKKTNFYIDGDAVGYITREGLMYGGSKKRLLGRCNPFSEEHDSIVIWDKEVAHILKRGQEKKRVNPRVFEVMEKLSKKETLLLIALGFLTLLEGTFEIEGAQSE
jgi:hypothetical protein